MLAEFLDIDKNLIANPYVQSGSDEGNCWQKQSDGYQSYENRRTEKAVRAGYDMDIIPSDLNTYGGEAKRPEDLQSRNECMSCNSALFKYRKDKAGTG